MFKEKDGDTSDDKDDSEDTLHEDTNDTFSINTYNKVTYSKTHCTAFNGEQIKDTTALDEKPSGKRENRQTVKTEEGSPEG